MPTKVSRLCTNKTSTFLIIHLGIIWHLRLIVKIHTCIIFDIAMVLILMITSTKFWRLFKFIIAKSILFVHSIGWISSLPWCLTSITTFCIILVTASISLFYFTFGLIILIHLLFSLNHFLLFNILCELPLAFFL